MRKKFRLLSKKYKIIIALTIVLHSETCYAQATKIFKFLSENILVTDTDKKNELNSIHIDALKSIESTNIKKGIKENPYTIPFDFYNFSEVSFFNSDSIRFYWIGLNSIIHQFGDSLECHKFALKNDFLISIKEDSISCVIGSCISPTINSIFPKRDISIHAKVALMHGVFNDIDTVVNVSEDSTYCYFYARSKWREFFLYGIDKRNLNHAIWSENLNYSFKYYNCSLDDIKRLERIQEFCYYDFAKLEIELLRNK